MTAAAASAAGPDLISLADAAAKDAAALVAEARRRVRAKVVADGRISAERLEAEQHAAPGRARVAAHAQGDPGKGGCDPPPPGGGPLWGAGGPPRRPGVRGYPDPN